MAFSAPWDISKPSSLLTTDRAETFGSAVQSKLNLPLKFKYLAESAQKAICVRKCLAADRNAGDEALG
jgi:hypothetical protein